MLMPTTKIPSKNLTIRLNAQKKDDFAVFSKRIGVTMNGAIDMFITAALRTGRLPFEVVDPLSDPVIKATVDREIEERLAIADSPDAKYFSHEEAGKLLGF